jgi:hypothetical protein
VREESDQEVRRPRRQRDLAFSARPWRLDSRFDTGQGHRAANLARQNCNSAPQIWCSLFRIWAALAAQGSRETRHF